jgi:hypothetical protein
MQRRGAADSTLANPDNDTVSTFLLGRDYVLKPGGLLDFPPRMSQNVPPESSGEPRKPSSYIWRISRYAPAITQLSLAHLSLPGRDNSVISRV